MPTTVYLLSDPRNNAPRYVGITTRSLEKRLVRHLNLENREIDHRSNWVRQLKSLGLKPMIEQLAVVEDSIRTEAEQGWINFFRQIGADLVNSTSGGGGLFNPSPETREKLRQKSLGKKLSEQTKAKIRAARASQITTEETREKMSSSRMGHSVSQETKNKISMANKGSIRTEESKIKMSLAKKGKPNPKHSEYMKKYWHDRKMIS